MRKEPVYKTFDKRFLRKVARSADSSSKHLRLAYAALERSLSQELTPRQGQLVYLYYFDRHSVPEIAQMLCRDKSTIYRTLRRATRRLRSGMQIYFDAMHLLPES